MSIAWKYLDKKAAATDALKDFSIMEFILKCHPAELEEAREEMINYRSSVTDGLPKAKDPHGGEARLAACIDEIDVLRERYRQALEFMEWFRPAWDELSNDERFVLTEYYCTETDAIDSISRYFSIERTSAYKRKNRALARLTVFLYGKN